MSIVEDDLIIKCVIV